MFLILNMTCNTITIKIDGYILFNTKDQMNYLNDERRRFLLICVCLFFGCLLIRVARETCRENARKRRNDMAVLQLNALV